MINLQVLYPYFDHKGIYKATTISLVYDLTQLIIQNHISAYMRREKITT